MKKGEAPREDGEVASFTECTGLMPALPADEAQDEAMASLYAVHRAKGSRTESPHRG